MHARFVRAFIVNYKGRTVANPNPSGRRTVGVPNKMSRARVERALREGKRLPLENLLVPVGNLRSKILMVQSAQNRHRQRATDGLNGTRDRRAANDAAGLGWRLLMSVFGLLFLRAL